MLLKILSLEAEPFQIFYYRCSKFSRVQFPRVRHLHGGDELAGPGDDLESVRTPVPQELHQVLVSREARLSVLPRLRRAAGRLPDFVQIEFREKMKKQRPSSKIFLNLKIFFSLQCKLCVENKWIYYNDKGLLALCCSYIKQNLLLNGPFHFFLYEHTGWGNFLSRKRL